MESGKAGMSRQRRPIGRDQLITWEDLQTFKEELLTGIKKLLLESKGQVTKQWIKSYEVKKILNISTGTLQNLRRNGTLPYTKIGGLVYYELDEINRILQDRKVGMFLQEK